MKATSTPAKNSLRHERLTLYGIKTCDTTRAARAWLEERGLDLRFHDYRVDGLTPETLAGFVHALGWETVLNRASATFKALPEAARASLDEKKALALMLKEPTMIKRPIVERAEVYVAGFKPEVYEAAFGTGA